MAVLTFDHLNHSQALRDGVGTYRSVIARNPSLRARNAGG